MDIKEDGGDAILTEFKMPEWVEMILAVSRISELLDRIREERDERKKDTYQNPHEDLYEVVTHRYFEGAIALAIVTNCVLIGWQASVPENTYAVFFNIVEHCFVALFLGEWILRMVVFGWVWTFEDVNAADTFLVFGTGVIPKWIVEGLMGISLGNVRILTCMRAFRLVRLVRAVRTWPQFRELWVLIQGLVQSIRPLIWTAVIALMILYIFGVAATELIGRQEAFADDEHAQELFGNPVRSMFTMFQLMTMDSWGYTIARPVMEKQWYLCWFFVFFIMIGVFVFWNLITAVIVENAFSIAREDAADMSRQADAQKKQELKQLAELFMEIDTDGTGDLSREEFTVGLANPKVRRILDLLEVKTDDAMMLWDVLDDGDGMLTIKEFTGGIRRMKGEAKAKDIVDIVKKLRYTAMYHEQVKTKVHSLGHNLKHLEHDVVRIQHDTAEVLGLFREMYHRLEAHIENASAKDKARALQLRKQREAEEAEAEATGQSWRPGSGGEQEEEEDGWQVEDMG